MTITDHHAREKEPAVLVREIMTSPAVTIRPIDEVAEAARVLNRLSLTTLPVVDHDLRLLGIISEADVIGSHGRLDVPLVSDVMTRDVFTAQADDDLSTVVALMSRTVLKSMPVLLRGRVVGVISRRDLVRAMTRGDLDTPWSLVGTERF